MKTSFAKDRHNSGNDNDSTNIEEREETINDDGSKLPIGKRLLSFDFYQTRVASITCILSKLKLLQKSSSRNS
eukprot:3673876-Amphidinium_carterae.1